MSYASMLVHRCSVFLVKETQPAQSYGVPKNTEFSYDDLPDSTNVPCLFAPLGRDYVRQEVPNSQISESFLVHFLPNVDVRINAKLVWEGESYRLQKPRNIRNHHIEVVAQLDKSL